MRQYLARIVCLIIGHDLWYEGDRYEECSRCGWSWGVKLREEA